MSTSVPHQTAALHHIGQLRRVAALKATQEMLKAQPHGEFMEINSTGPAARSSHIWIPGNKEAWVAALKAQLLDIGGSGEPSTEECSLSWEQSVG